MHISAHRSHARSNYGHKPIWRSNYYSKFFQKIERPIQRTFSCNHTSIYTNFSPENDDLFAEASESCVVSCMSKQSFTDALAILYFRKSEMDLKIRQMALVLLMRPLWPYPRGTRSPRGRLRAARIHPDLHIISKASLRRASDIVNILYPSPYILNSDLILGSLGISYH